MLVAAVCGARTLSQGAPPLGIVCAQQDLAHVYPLSDDPEHCLEDFEERAAVHARRTAQRLDHQEASVDALPRAQRRRLPADRLTHGGAPRRAVVTMGAREAPRPHRPRGRRVPRRQFGVTRYLNNDTVERARVVELLREQARGDAPAMLARLKDCDDAACVAIVRANATKLRRRGEVKIALYQSQTAHALKSRTKYTRVVWFPPDRRR